MRRRWTRYRGKRAGIHAKWRTYRNHLKIHRILSVQSKRNVKQNSREQRRNLGNNVSVAPWRLRRIHQDRFFVPSILLSNVMSLAPKIDEVSTCVQNANFDLVCITETWLKQHIPDNAVIIDGYNLIRLDRKEGIHGGVCMYLREQIPFSIIDIPQEDGYNLEVLWIQIRPPRLPRGISDIVLGVIYHPPSANDAIMLDYLTNCLSTLEANNPNSGIILLGDLNRTLNTSRLSFNFGLKQIINFPPRGSNTLDKILTNLHHF